MHFVCSPFGSSGDVHPMLGLAVALKSRGHRVTMVCNGYFESLVRSRSLDFVQLGTEEEFLTLAKRKELWQPLKAFPFLYREGVAPSMQQHFELLADFQRAGPLVAISNIFGFGARVAEEKLGIPLVMLHLQPSVIWSDIAPPQVPGLCGPRWMKRLIYRAGERFVIDRAVCPSFNAWRAQLGLPPIHQVTRWWNQAWCVACLFPAWFAPPQADWPQSHIQTGFPLWDERTDQPLPTELDRFLAKGDAPVAFTPGSANVYGRPFFAAAVETCRRMGRRGVLLTRFPEQLPGSLPDDVMHVSYVPFSQLLPRCAALVHHGGVGSMSQAMAAGIPQLIVAMAHDQFDNGQRVERLGVGRSIHHRGVNAKKLVVALAPLLESDTVRPRCQRLADRIAGAQGIDKMAAELESRLAEPIEHAWRLPMDEPHGKGRSV